MEVENTEDRRWCVYMHTNTINNKAYIGQTSQQPEIRWKNGDGYKCCSYFYNAIQKYGWDNFEHIIWANDLTQHEAYKIEKLLISLFDTTSPDHGYNLSTGGQLGPIGVRRTEETKEKLRLLNTGINNPNYGLKRSEETKQRIKESLIGKSKTYKDENGNPLKISIYQYDTNGNVICSYSCAYEASERTGISRSAIENCIYGLSKTAGEYIWRRSNELLTEDDIKNISTTPKKNRVVKEFSAYSWFDKDKQKYRVKFKKDGKYVKTKTYNTKEDADNAILKYINN